MAKSQSMFTKAKLKLEEMPNLAHLVSDEELERVKAFCDEVAPVARQGGELSAEAEAQQAQQAKLLRYIKRMSKGNEMFDKEWFMCHIVDMNMVGLGSDSPTIGENGIRYHLHDAGPANRGLVVLFHGLVGHLRKETDALATAYVRGLKVSVCVVDYRQLTSKVNEDGQTVLENLDVISGSSSKPVILHGVGFGATLAIHVALASQVMPRAVAARLRLLVLDGAMGAIHMNVGCTTKDPIGNDSKLAYNRMNICMLGGDDKLCGLTVQEVQWNQISEIGSELLRTKKISALSSSTGGALDDRVLNPVLFQMGNTTLDALSAAPPPAAALLAGEEEETFVSDVLDVSESFSKEKDPDEVAAWTPKAKSQPKDQVIALCKQALESCTGRASDPLTDAVTAATAAERDALYVKAMILGICPHLKVHGGFLPGVEGLKQFRSAYEQLSEFFSEIEKLGVQLKNTYDFELLRKLSLDRLQHIAKDCGEDGGGGADDGGGDGGGVVIKHLTKGGEITVNVPESATILEVRQAIMAKLKEPALNKVKLVIQQAKGTKMIPDGDVLGPRKELLMVGRPFT